MVVFMQKKSFPYFKYTDTGYKNFRTGILHTKHGNIKTPAFIFCATRGAIKSLDVLQAKQAGTQVMLSNTYHLMLKPGGKYVEALGGLQKFTGWNGPMLTDSGGFQVFSLNHKDNGVDELKRKYAGANCFGCSGGIVKIEEEGITCKSYYDGSKFFLSPESSVKEQIALGADLIVVFDECTKFSEDLEFNKLALERNNRWAARSLDYFNQNKKPWQGIYGIVHGGIFKDLRQQSVRFNNQKNFFGFAIGGSLGRTKKEMQDVVGFSVENLDQKRPRHLLGVGGISDIFMGVEMGIDTFDCVHPTRIARHGGALFKKSNGSFDSDKEYINLRNSKFRGVDKPIEEDCKCQTCQNYSVGYLNYLFAAGERIAFNIVAYHNVYFMNRLMTEIRESTLHLSGFEDLKQSYLC